MAKIIFDNKGEERYRVIDSLSGEIFEESSN